MGVGDPSLRSPVKFFFLITRYTLAKSFVIVRSPKPRSELSALRDCNAAADLLSAVLAGMLLTADFAVVRAEERNLPEELAKQNLACDLEIQERLVSIEKKLDQILQMANQYQSPETTKAEAKTVSGRSNHRYYRHRHYRHRRR